MTPQLVDGWLVVSCDAHDHAQVWLSVGDREPGEWRPAYRDWLDGAKVAKVRAPSGPGKVRVWIRVGDRETRVGSVTL